MLRVTGKVHGRVLIERLMEVIERKISKEQRLCGLDIYN